MRHRDNNNRLVLDAIYQRVSKTSKQTLSYVCLYFNGRKGVGLDETNNTIQFIKKIHAPAAGFFIEPDDSFIDFLLS